MQGQAAFDNIDSILWQCPDISNLEDLITKFPNLELDKLGILCYYTNGVLSCPNMCGPMHQLFNALSKDLFIELPEGWATDTDSGDHSHWGIDLIAERLGEVLEELCAKVYGCKTPEDFQVALDNWDCCLRTAPQVYHCHQQRTDNKPQLVHTILKRMTTNMVDMPKVKMVMEEDLRIQTEKHAKVAACTDTPKATPKAEDCNHRSPSKEGGFIVGGNVGRGFDGDGGFDADGANNFSGARLVGLKRKLVEMDNEDEGGHLPKVQKVNAMIPNHTSAKPTQPSKSCIVVKPNSPSCSASSPPPSATIPTHLSCYPRENRMTKSKGPSYNPHSSSQC